jgi:hypothetical protein
MNIERPTPQFKALTQFLIIDSLLDVGGGIQMAMRGGRIDYSYGFLTKERK